MQLGIFIEFNDMFYFYLRNLLLYEIYIFLLIYEILYFTILFNNNNDFITSILIFLVNGTNNNAMTTCDKDGNQKFLVQKSSK